MIKVNAFGKSCIFGFIGRKFRIHYTSMERIVRFENLVFRIHPSDGRKEMARVNFRNGYSIDVVPVKDNGKRYYDVEIFKGGKPIKENSELRYLTASYCSEETVDAILEYYQRQS